MFYQQRVGRLVLFAAARRRDTAYLYVFSSKWSKKSATETQKTPRYKRLLNEACVFTDECTVRG